MGGEYPRYYPLQLSPLVRSTVFVALAASIGLHWAAMQGVAWMGMFAEFSRTHSMGEAVSMTFDGRHPCALCLLVQDGAARDQGQQDDGAPATRHDFKLSLIWEVPGTALLTGPSPERQPHVPRRDRPTGRLEAPPVPPPRAEV